MAALVEVEDHDDVVLARASTDMDVVTADTVRDTCLAAVTNHHIGLILDLSRSDYLDSAGIRAVFEIAKRLEPHRQRLALVVPPESNIRRVLALVDIESGASLHEAAEAAFERLRAPA